MTTLGDKILRLLRHSPGLTDREITDRIKGQGEPQQAVNITCRNLQKKRLLDRRTRDDGLIGNWSKGDNKPASSTRPPKPARISGDAGAGELSEDEIKKVLVDWLERDGWLTEVAWGSKRGIDIDARRGNERWIIEVKGPGSRNPMRVNYFLAILGETLQRMDDPNARYSIALPDMRQYRRLWERLPDLAKTRSGIDLILVDRKGAIEYFS